MVPAISGRIPITDARALHSSAVPQSVTRAVQLMYVGAAASLIGIVIDIWHGEPIRSAIATRKTPTP